ncbi:MAG: MerC domain-containing protein [Bacteroidota bacterium]
MKNQFAGLHIDFVGFVASLLCAIHCAALPFLLTLAPLAGLQFLDNHWVEYAIILFSFVIATRALLQGYRRHHKKVIPLILAVVGFVLIGIGQVMELEWMEALFMSVGGVTIAVAHLINWRLLRRSQWFALQGSINTKTA